MRPLIVAGLLVVAAGLAFTSTAIAQSTFDPGTQRRTLLDRAVPIPRPAPRLCQDICLNDQICRAWTFVRQPGPDGVQCWLGSLPVPAVQDDCCASGLTR